MMLTQDLGDQIGSNTKARERKAAAMAEAGESKAQAEGDLGAAKQALAEDEKFLADLNAECTQKSLDFEKRQGIRQGEIDAIGKAIEIMSGGAVARGTQYTGLTQEQTDALGP